MRPPRLQAPHPAFEPDSAITKAPGPGFSVVLFNKGWRLWNCGALIETHGSNQPSICTLTAFMAYTAYVLSPESRAAILERFRPRFSDVICHHVTERFGVPAIKKFMPEPAEIVVVGYASDASLEALVVTVNGVTARRDGMVYHITLSLERSQGRRPVDSNQLIASAGWTIVVPLTITAVPRLR